MIEDERLAEELLGEQDAARERQREQEEAHGDQPEQESLEREKRRSRRRLRVERAPAQPLFEPHQHERLQRGDQEHRVGDESDRDVHCGERIVAVAEPVRIDDECGQERSHRRDGEHDGPDGGQRGEESRDPRDRGDEPGDHRHRVDERQVEAFRRRDRVPAQEAVEDERERHEPRRRAGWHPVAETARSGAPRGGRPQRIRGEPVQGHDGHVE